MRFTATCLASLASLACLVTGVLPASAQHPASPPPTAASFRESPAGRDTIQALRKGGHVLFLRHGHTDQARQDQHPLDLANCASQRPLSQKGRKDAARLGVAMRRAGIPVGEVVVSPLCRALETAASAFPSPPAVVDRDLRNPARMPVDAKASIVARTRQLLSTPPPAGTNRLVVAHAPNLMETLGHYPPEAALVVLQPRGGGHFDYVATIPIEDWQRLVP